MNSKVEKTLAAGSQNKESPSVFSDRESHRSHEHSTRKPVRPSSESLATRDAVPVLDPCILQWPTRSDEETRHISISGGSVTAASARAQAAGLRGQACGSGDALVGRKALCGEDTLGGSSEKRDGQWRPCASGTAEIRVHGSRAGREAGTGRHGVRAHQGWLESAALQPCAPGRPESVAMASMCAGNCWNRAGAVPRGASDLVGCGAKFRPL
jgi:hypothetical protein